jgi:hypothetical protein
VTRSIVPGAISAVGISSSERLQTKAFTRSSLYCSCDCDSTATSQYLFKRAWHLFRTFRSLMALAEQSKA